MRIDKPATFGDGQRITLSFVVAASNEGEVFDLECVFAEADSALYAAKRAGRNRVCAAGEDGETGRWSRHPVPLARPAQAV